MIPDPSNPQAWNRYSYVYGNPINFNDATGHKACTDDGYCGKLSDTSYQKHIYSKAIKDVFKWNLKGKWSLDELKTIYQTGRDIEKFADEATGGNGLDWMISKLGNTTIEHGYHDDGHSDALPFLGEGFGPRIRLDQKWMTNSWGAKVVFAHELGHVWDINSGFSYSGDMNRDLRDSSWCYFCSPNGAPNWAKEYHRFNGDAYGNSRRNEYFAEAFAATIYTPSDPSVVPSGVSDWINWQMSIDLINYLVPGARS